MVGTEVDVVDACTFTGEERQQALMHRGQICLCEKAAGNAGLVRDDEDFDSEFVRFADRPGSTRNQFQLLRSGKKIHLGVQGAITVKEDSDLFDLHAGTIAEVLCRD